jgi:hypothetical protein
MTTTRKISRVTGGEREKGRREKKKNRLSTPLTGIAHKKQEVSHPTPLPSHFQSVL